MRELERAATVTGARSPHVAIAGAPKPSFATPGDRAERHSAVCDGAASLSGRTWRAYDKVMPPNLGRRTTCNPRRMEGDSPPPIVGTPHDHEIDIARQVVALREYHIAEAATSALAIVIERTTSMPLPDEHSARHHRTAVTVTSIRAFRALRAGMAILCRGYALEADMLTRVMLELYVAATEVLAETSGQEAERWLTKGMGKGIKARVDAQVPRPEGVYGPLSRAAHGDPRAVLGLLITADDEHAIEWGPALTPRIADVLRSYAVGARDFAVLLEQVARHINPEVERLDEMLVAAIPGFDPARDWSTGT